MPTGQEGKPDAKSGPTPDVNTDVKQEGTSGSTRGVAIGAEVAQAVIPGIPVKGADRVKKSPDRASERMEMMRRIDINWDDGYLLEFAKQYPDVIRPFVDDIGKIAAMDRTSPDYALTKSQFFGRMLPVLDENIRKIVERISELKGGLGTEADPGARESLKEAFFLNQKFLKEIGDFKMNVFLYKAAYERFSYNRAEIERKLMAKIKSGEVVIPEELPYVTFVNKNPGEQYVLVYKYEKAQQKLSLKSCNLASTGDQLRWGKDDHTTPSRVYYVGSVVGLDHSSIREGAEVYGREAMRIEQKPYQIFRLFKSENGEYVRTSYLMHPTNEEPLLGETASHGCIRTSRLTNLQIQKIYEEYFRGQGVTDFSKFPPDQMRTPKAKMPVVIDDVAK
jgi:hypothetical protein